MNIPTWKEDLQSNLTRAAPGVRPTSIRGWISRCWADGVTLNHVLNPENLDLLDQSLSMGMLHKIEASHETKVILCLLICTAVGRFASTWERCFWVVLS